MADWTGAGLTTADVYRTMANNQLRGVSPTYEALCRAVAADASMLARLDAVPPSKRQPNLLLAAVRYLGGPVSNPTDFLGWAAQNWSAVEAVVMTRRTQTNEPRRCATLVPVLAGLRQPLALIEVGASAGLCLIPDRYAYRYRTSVAERVVGSSSLELSCGIAGPVPVPVRPPDVVWRVGLDLNPLDVADPDDVRWLRSLIWPEQTERFETLAGAVELARHDPPRLVRGDLLTDLAALVHDAPIDATLVVFHSAVLAYLDGPDRERFASSLRGFGRDVVWVSNEAPGVVPGTEIAASEPSRFVLAVDGRPCALTGPHGATLEWLDWSSGL